MSLLPMIGCSVDKFCFEGVTYVLRAASGSFSSEVRGLLSSAIKGNASGIGWKSNEENWIGETVRESVRE